MGLVANYWCQNPWLSVSDEHFILECNENSQLFSSLQMTRVRGSIETQKAMQQVRRQILTITMQRSVPRFWDWFRPNRRFFSSLQTDNGCQVFLQSASNIFVEDFKDFVERKSSWNLRWRLCFVIALADLSLMVAKLAGCCRASGIREVTV